ncbi:uncharacterized protein LOC132785391 [Drosophila nasuta]|uniref:uncharacterized protein LOC132785391 n=1 Tax=Drosophila nasuta TaxID=42062 RepID=UPI00295EF04F|nr:uncharacterized protein LOC132785391 [Drosophila nasuta]
MSEPSPLRQRDELRRSKSPSGGAKEASRGRGERSSRLRIKKRVRICVHTAEGSSLRRTMGGRCEVCKAPTPTDGGQRPAHARGAADSGRGGRGGAQLPPARSRKPRPQRRRGANPGHLLVGGPLVAPAASRTPDQEGLSCLRRWRAVSSLKRAFWQRWSGSMCSACRHGPSGTSCSRICKSESSSSSQKTTSRRCSGWWVESWRCIQERTGRCASQTCEPAQEGCLNGQYTNWRLCQSDEGTAVHRGRCWRI